MSAGQRTAAAAGVMPPSRRYPVTFVRGKGFYLYDETGRPYLDFVAGVAVTALGHAHPAVTEAVARQAGRLVHTSNLYYTEPMADLAGRLTGLLGWSDGRVFFANSGAEANECALKLVRKASRTRSSIGERSLKERSSIGERSLKERSSIGERSLKERSSI